MINTTHVLTFLSGAAVGAVASWLILKNKFDRKLGEAIDSVESIQAKRDQEKNDPIEETEETSELSEYKDAVTNLGYSNEKEDEEYMEKPYVITPEEFGELENYKTVSLTYYDDGVLTDEFDDVIDDIESVVGYESLKHFGEYEDDSVFVRNDKTKCDYEILLDQRKYSDVVGE